MNLDVSVAPEIAQLIEPRRAPYGTPPAPGPGQAGRGQAGTGWPGDGGAPAGAQPPTAGRLAAQLRLIAASPDRWWGLVRFDPARPVRVAMPAEPWSEAWLMIIPPSPRDGRPGDAARWAGHGAECGCQVAAVVAGEVAEVIEVPVVSEVPGNAGAAMPPLLPGRVRVHAPGHSHRVVNLGRTYAVTMHARGR